MKNNYISYYKLPILSQLFQQRALSLNTVINNLKIGNIEDDEMFEKTKNNIKTSILFEPITFGEPEFVDFEYSERAITTQQLYFGGYSKDQYFHKVKFPFSGDNELLSYSSGGVSIYSSDHGIVEPSGNKFVVYVDLSELNPDKSINEANSLLRLTKEVAEKNSAEAKVWNAAMEKRIDEELEVKRSQLIKIFRKK